MALNVTVMGRTNTQAVLSYTAPDVLPCTVEISESSSFVPLVNDVNPTLFTNANSDGRAEALVNGTARIFVAGKRTAETALDGNVYSRALQAYTVHYYRVTCSAAVATGSFQTNNIAIGMTYSDLPQVDNNHPGQHLLPPLPLDRNSTVVDPHTGGLIRRITLSTDGVIHPFLQDDGEIRHCGPYLIGPGPGFLCSFDGQSSPAGLYYIIPTTGEVRFLGMMQYNLSYSENLRSGGANTPIVDTSSPGIFYTLAWDLNERRTIVKGTYTGNFAAVPDGIYAAMTWNNMTPPPQDLTTIIKGLNPSYDMSVATNCNLAFGNRYGMVTCLYGIQNSYGWAVILDFGNRVPAGKCGAHPAQCIHPIAGTKVWLSSAARWCGIHATSLHSTQPVVRITGQDMNGIARIGGGTLGNGPYVTTIMQSVGPSDNLLQTSGEPLNAGAPDAFLLAAQPGDLFKFSDTGELVQITAKVNSTTWQVNRGFYGLIPAVSHPAGTTVQAVCQQTHAPSSQHYELYWNFLGDPSGNSYISDPYGPAGHEDWNDNFRGSYTAVVGPLMQEFKKLPNFSIATSPAFAGADAYADGNILTRHPSVHQDSTLWPASQSNWFSDIAPWSGGVGMKSAITLVSGQLYKYQTGAKAQLGKLTRKQMATIAVSAGNPLVDASGPGSQLSGGASDSYKYCVANLAGECYPGSNRGDVYINVPNLQYDFCRGLFAPDPVDVDACVANMPMHAQGVLQVGYTMNGAGLRMGGPGTIRFRKQYIPLYGAGYTRVVTQGLAGIRRMFIFPTAKPLPDASWIIFPFINQQPPVNVNYTDHLLMVKLPPVPLPDGVDRSTFVRAPLTLVPPQGLGITSAVVRFGYAEQGGANQYKCTSRNEVCVVVASTVDDGHPFFYAQTETYAAAPCATSCMITLPVLPMHTAYFRVSYLDLNGREVVAQRGVAAESALAILP
jgi:hypothetical protein